jgi:urease subunit alpha
MYLTPRELDKLLIYSMADIAGELGLKRKVMPVYATRTLTKRDMIRNAATPHIEVNPETFAVMVDGKHATVPAAPSIRLNQMYFFS